MLAMRSVAADVAHSVVCTSVCLLNTQVSSAKMAEQIDMPFVGRLVLAQGNMC